MGFSFRKSKKIGPFRFNLNSRGVSMSLGVKGARVNLSSTRGATASVGLGGVRYQTRLGAGGGGAAPKAWDVPELAVEQSATPQAAFPVEAPAFEGDEAETARVYDEAFARYRLHQKRATKALAWAMCSGIPMLIIAYVIGSAERETHAPTSLALSFLLFGLLVTFACSSLAMFLFAGLAGTCRYGHRDARYNVRSGFGSLRQLYKVLQRAGAAQTTFVHLIDVERVPWYRVRWVKKLALRFLEDIQGARVVFTPGHVCLAYGEQVVDMCDYSDLVFRHTEHYEHENKDGGPDRRYAYNPVFTVTVFVIGSHTATVRLDWGAAELLSVLHALQSSNPEPTQHLESDIERNRMGA